MNILKIATIIATVIVLIIIVLMVEGAYIGYELDKDAKNGCCCGATDFYAAPMSQKCAAKYSHVAGLCSSGACKAAGS